VRQETSERGDRLDRRRVTKIGNFGCSNHAGELDLFMKSLNMIQNCFVK